MELLNKVKNLIAEADWNFCSHSDGITLESKLFPSISQISCFRASCIINARPDQVMAQIWDINESKVKRDNPDVLEWNLIETDENFRIYRQLNKVTWPLWPREVVIHQSKTLEDNSYLIISHSIEHPLVPKQNDKFVRATVYISAYCLFPDCENTKIFRIMHLDPGGYIPPAVVNYNSNKLVTYFQKLKAVFS